MGMLFVMLISQYEPFGKYSMLYSDMYHQYYPFFVAFRRALPQRERAAVHMEHRHGDGLSGADLLLSGIAAEPAQRSGAGGLAAGVFSLLVPVKLGFAGMFFAIFLKKLFGKNDASIAVFGGFTGCARGRWGISGM